MKILYSLLASLGLLSYFQTNTEVTQDCFSDENFEKAYHYLEWKHATSKKNGEYRGVMLGKYEVKLGNKQTAPALIGVLGIVFSQEKWSHFGFYKEKGFVPHIKTPLSKKKNNQLFCDLVQMATKQNLPKNYVYHYSDGSSNLWTITDNALEYAPTTPETSSSGFYSGGKAFKKTITEQEFREIEKTLQKSFIDILPYSENPLLDRQKGTGKISKSVNLTVEISSKVLAMNAIEKKEIETLLNAQKP